MAGSERPSFQGIIGRSAPMPALFQRIERVAPIDVPALIQGETGTGKELVARAIWQLSARRGRRFEAVNAGASVADILQGYPDLEAQDIQQALEYAAWLTREEVRSP